MPKVPFVAQSSAQPDHKVNTGERVVNMYPEVTSKDGRSFVTLRNVPGSEAFTPIGSAHVSIDFIAVNEFVSGVAFMWMTSTSSGTVTSLFNVLSDGSLTFASSRAEIPDFDTEMVYGLGYVFWCQNGKLFRYEPNTASTILDAGTSGPFATEHDTVTILNNHVIASKQNSRVFGWSNSGDPLFDEPLNFATKESKEDFIVRVIASQGRLYVLGSNTSELWALSGLGGVEAFQWVPGAITDVGLLGKQFALDFEDSLWMISDHKTLIQVKGFSFVEASPQWVNDALQNFTPTRLFAFEDRGHKFVCIRFSDRAAICYDTLQQRWFERSSLSEDEILADIPELAEPGPWNITSTTQGPDAWYGVREGSGIVRLVRNHIDEATNGVSEVALIRRLTSRPLERDGEIFNVAKVGIRAQPPGSGSNGYTLYNSRDGGRTWRNGRSKNMVSSNKSGRINFRNFGNARLFQVMLACSDPSETVVEAAAIVELG